MAAWRIVDLSEFSAQCGLQCHQLDYDPERMLGFMILSNSNGHILRIRIDITKRILCQDDIDEYHRSERLTEKQAGYLKTAGNDLAQCVYSALNT